MSYREKKTATKGERQVLKGGKAWMRWLMIPVAVLSVLDVIDKPYRFAGFIVLFISIILFFLLKRARRLEHDELNIYIIRDKKEKVIPFTSVISIKKSRTKVNGSRFWIVRYKDENDQKTRKFRYFRSFFNKEFLQLVRIANPKVVIWTHPFFAHAEDNKHNPDYKE